MNDTYRAALPIHESKQDLEQNLKKYEEYARTAGNPKPDKVLTDILVYPEFGLLPFDFSNMDKKQLYPFCDTIPPDPLPCTIPPGHPILYPASHWASTNQLYIVIDLLTRHGEDIHVTDAVFNRDGKMIAHYDKFNIWTPQLFSPPSELKVTHFETDFSVKFGLIICADILIPGLHEKFKEMGIKHFPYCAAQNFLGAPIAWAWSAFCQVTVLAANLATPTSKFLKDSVGIFQNGKVVESPGVIENVFFGDVEKNPGIPFAFELDKAFPEFTGFLK